MILILVLCALVWDCFELEDGLQTAGDRWPATASDRQWSMAAAGGRWRLSMAGGRRKDGKGVWSGADLNRRAYGRGCVYVYTTERGAERS